MRTRPSPVGPSERRFLAWLYLLVLSHPQAQERPGEWVDRERLLAGEDIQMDFGGEGRFRGLVRAALIIRADREAIWEILTDCASAPDYVPHVVRCELVETLDDGLTQIFRQQVKYAWFLPRFEHVFSLRYQPYGRIDVERVSGPIEHMRGVWRLFPADGGATLLTYELELRPGLPVPGFLVGATLSRDTPIILSEVRERAEAAARRGF